MKLLSADTIRRCLVADMGHAILSADFDQIEWRVIGALSGETAIIEAAKRGESIHKLAAKRMFGEYTPDQYRFTKNLNFGWAFGGGAKTLSEQTGVPIAQCIPFIKQYEGEFPALAAWKRKEQNAVLKAALTPGELNAYYSLRSRMYSYRTDTAKGRAARKALDIEIKRLLWRKTATVVLPHGRRLLVDAEKSYAVVNYKVQGTAAHLFKQALIDVWADEELQPTVLLPIHDELLGQAPVKQAERIAHKYGEVMSREFMGVPITASGKVYGQSWGHGYRKKE